MVKLGGEKSKSTHLIHSHHQTYKLLLKEENKKMAEMVASRENYF